MFFDLMIFAAYNFKNFLYLLKLSALWSEQIQWKQ